MEKLVDSGQIAGVIDLTTTEVADMLMGGVLPATEDRFGAIIRTRMPYVGSVGALDMVNFGALASVPERYQGPQAACPQSAGDADAHHRRGERRASAAGSASGSTGWTGRCASSCPNSASRRSTPPASRSSIPRRTRRCSARCEQTVRQTSNRQIVRVRRHINDPEFAAAVVAAFRSLMGRGGERRRASR